jgi:signal transduction histidine kinase
MGERVAFSSSLASPMIYVDHFSLETVVKNLLDNALFYSVEESIVSASIEKEGDGSIVIKIKNISSNPLTQDDLNNIFKPLYQVDKSRTHTDRHGLGLAIVKNIAQLNGYDLSVDYQESREVTFTVVIPQG